MGLESSWADRLVWLGYHPYEPELHKLLDDYKIFCIVDLQQSQRTASSRRSYIKKCLRTINKPLDTITARDIRQYLYQRYQRLSPSSYSNDLKALKRFFRDFLKRPDVVQSFKFPKTPFKPKHIVSKEEVQLFYHSLTSLQDQALFLILATSGLRRNEILTLTDNDIDLSMRMIIPNTHDRHSTKHSWVSFFNTETSKVLMEYLPHRSKHNARLFPYATKKLNIIWQEARKRTNVNITPQRLREFFSMQMSILGVPDRFIDALQGRTPRSVLARHYTDYRPETLKKIYDNAHLTVLT